jgi:hypothetical protein
VSGVIDVEAARWAANHGRTPRDFYDHLARQVPGDITRGGGFQVHVSGRWTGDRVVIALTLGRLQAERRARRTERRPAVRKAAA